MVYTFATIILILSAFNPWLKHFYGKLVFNKALVILVVGAIVGILAFLSKGRNFKVYGVISVILNVCLMLFLDSQHLTESFYTLNMQSNNFFYLQKANSASSLFVGYLYSINFFTMVFYLWDKRIAVWFPKETSKVKLRVPENFLHWYEAPGGIPAAVFSQWCFNHKHNDDEYQKIFRTILVIQIILFFFIFCLGAGLN